jgi:ABC-2 type transport system permease protein
VTEIARPYAAAFRSRFLLLVQYRAAAIAGFMTQCWWGAIKVMVYAAFYHASAAASAAPMTLAQVVTYTWLAQAFLALSPWGADPDIALAVRTGSVSQDFLRPLDAYWLWYVRAAGWMTARALPRSLLMFLLAGVVLPLAGLGEWAWMPPPNVGQALLFVTSLGLVVALASSIVMLLNIAVTLTLNDRGVNSLFSAVAAVFSGNIVPLPLAPDWLRGALFVQPFAGLVDIPFRIYSGNLAGTPALAGIALQIGWTIVFVTMGHAWMRTVERRLEIQGG